MSALLLLGIALGGLTVGFCALAVLLWRVAMEAFSAALDGAAKEMR